MVLDNLLDKKLISKSLDPADRRRRIVALTGKGRSHIERRFPVHVRELRKLMGVLSTSEKQQLEKLLNRLERGFTQFT